MELKAVEDGKSRESQLQVVIFENAGHCVNMDTPQKFHEVMEEFWGNTRVEPRRY